jgi:hypothetical protein
VLDTSALTLKGQAWELSMAGRNEPATCQPASGSQPAADQQRAARTVKTA